MLEVFFFQAVVLGHQLQLEVQNQYRVIRVLEGNRRQIRGPLMGSQLQVGQRHQLQL